MNKFILYIILLFFITGCGVTQYHTAKPLKKGEKQLFVAVDSYIAPSVQQYVYANEKIARKEAIKSMIPMLPTIEYNWGTTKRFDHTLSLGFERHLSYAFKLGLVGKSNSAFYMSVRPEIGVGVTGIFEPFVWNKNTLLLTQEFGEKFSLTFSPGITFVYLQGEAIMFSSGFAAHYGNKNRIFIASSFMRTKQFGLVEQFSIGYIFKLNKKQ